MNTALVLGARFREGAGIVVVFACCAAMLCLSARAAFCATHQPDADSMLASVQDAFDSGAMNASQAVRRYRVLVKRYPAAEDAVAEAKFEIARLSEKAGRTGAAVQAYRGVLEHPEGVFYLPAADALYEIAEGLFERGAGRFGGDYRLAGSIFRALTGVFEDPEKMAELHFKSGSCSFATGNHPAAEVDFDRVLERYPVEPWKEKSLYYLGSIYYRMRRPPSRDQTKTERAAGHLDDFIARYPRSEFRPAAEKKLAELREHMAEHLFNICRFYLARGHTDAARVYYRRLAEEYPGSRWLAELKEADFAD